MMLSLLKLMLGSLGVGHARYPVSDHYDGRRFFNPTHVEKHGFRDVFKFLVTHRNQKWPESVATTPDLKLGQILGGDQAAVTFVNHASVLIQIQGLNILTDPVWSERVSPLSWIGPKRVRAPGIPFEDLPRIDVVLISHDHYDHLDLATLKRLYDKFKPTFYVPLGNSALLKGEGFENVFELDWWDQRVVGPGVTVDFTPTQHFSGRGVFDHFKTLWGSYVVSFRGHRIYFGGDAAYSSHFAKIREKFGPMDLSLLAIGAYDPRWFMKPVHMNPEEAVRAHQDLASRQSIGIHFGTFQLTEEKIDQPVADLRAAARAAAVVDSKFIVLPEGHTRVYDLGKP